MSKTRDSNGRFIKNDNSILPPDFQDDNVMFRVINEIKNILSETLKKISFMWIIILVLVIPYIFRFRSSINEVLNFVSGVFVPPTHHLRFDDELVMRIVEHYEGDQAFEQMPEVLDNDKNWKEMKLRKQSIEEKMLDSIAMKKSYELEQEEKAKEIYLERKAKNALNNNSQVGSSSNSQTGPNLNQTTYSRSYRTPYPPSGRMNPQ